MTTELDIKKGEEGKENPPAPAPADPAPKEPEPKAPEKSPEEIQKEEHLANLDKAITEAEGELQRVRTETKDAKKAPPGGGEGSDDVPSFDENDPNVKALDKRIRGNTAPIQAELEKEKAEVRAFALREFLNSNPALAKDLNKVKEMMQYYEKIKTASERTREGVLLDLRKAAAVVFSEDLLNAAQGRRANEAKADEAFSAPAVGSGSTAYRRPKDSSGAPKLSEEDRQILARWGTTPEEWAEDFKKYGQQN